MLPWNPRGQPGNDPISKNACLADYSFGEARIARSPVPIRMRRPLGYIPSPVPAGAIFRALAVSRHATANSTGGRIMSDEQLKPHF